MRRFARLVMRGLSWAPWYCPIIATVTVLCSLPGLTHNHVVDAHGWPAFVALAVTEWIGMALAVAVVVALIVARPDPS